MIRNKIMPILLILLCGVGILSAQDITAQGTGYGTTQNEALSQAKRDALAKSIGQMLTSTTEVENYMVKKDLIITRTMGFIKKVDIISEVQGADGAWKIDITAVVAKDDLQSDLAAMGILIQQIGNPRIAMLIQETNIDDQAATANLSEAKLIDFFKSKTFEVVDPNAALRFRESAQGIAAIGGDPAAAAALGTQLNAEVMIVGSVVAKASDVSQIKAFAGSGMKSASAIISLKAVNVSTRQIMAAKTIDAAAVHVNQHTAGSRAMESALTKLLNENNGFFASLLESWRSSAADGSSFQLTIQNVQTFQQVKLVKQNVEKQVSTLTQRGFSKPSLTLDAVFLGSVEDLCEKLDGLNLGGATLSVEGYQGNSIQLKVKSN
jgi:hypothetical protein